MTVTPPKTKKLRSTSWFDDSQDPGMTALYLERYLNFGWTREELQSNRPIIGIAQTGSDLSPCNRHHLELAERVRAGIRDAGGIPFEFPVFPIQETGRRPTAALDRNLACMGLIETLHGYPIDGVVLTTGCDKTTPAQLMAAASVNLPAIVLSVGPMLNGHERGRLVGSGTIIWESRERMAKGEISKEEFMDLAAASAPSVGHCNTMGTATTMNSLAEALGMSLPGCAAIPAPYRERGQMSYETGKRIVDMVWEDLTPEKIMTRQAFENAIIMCSAIGGSTNAPPHINAIARHMGVALGIQDWQDVGQAIPQLVNCQPVGEYLGEDFFQAGGVPAVFAELLSADLCHGQAMTVNGKTIAENCADSHSWNRQVIYTAKTPVTEKAGLMVLTGNLFDSAVMKVSAIGEDFRQRYLSNPDDPDAFEVKAVIFDGPEMYHQNINNPELGIDAQTILVMRGAGPKGYPGSAEVVNMQAPDVLLKQGIRSLPTMGDGRQSGTSASPSILNISPESASGSGLAILQNGDYVRIDLRKRRVDVLISDAEYQQRMDQLDVTMVASQTPWQEIYRETVTELSDGAVMKSTDRYHNIVAAKPRHSH